MDELDKVIDALHVDRKLVLRFFAVFSRFEYSLKRSGFLKRRSGRKAGKGDWAEPDWYKYSKSLRGHFGKIQDKAFQDAVAFLRREPPKTQVVSGNGLGWRDTIQGKGDHHERYILRLVAMVRNNLFHGGTDGPQEDAGRNRRLLKATIVRLSPDVRQPVKTLLTVRWKILDRQYDCTAYWEPAGEAEAVPAGEQTAEE